MLEYRVAAIIKNKKEIAINKIKAYWILRYTGEDTTASIAKVLGWKLTETAERYKSC